MSFHSLPGTFAAWAVLRRAPGFGGYSIVWEMLVVAQLQPKQH